MRDRSHEGLRHQCKIAVTPLLDQDRNKDRLYRRLEAERLHALIDGLALYAATRPSVVDPGRVRAVLACHLDTLTRPS